MTATNINQAALPSQLLDNDVNLDLTKDKMQAITHADIQLDDIYNYLRVNNILIGNSDDILFIKVVMAVSVPFETLSIIDGY